MKKISYDQIKSYLNYEPAKIGININYKEDIYSFIGKFRSKVKEEDDILHIFCRDEFLSDKELRLFALSNAKKAREFIDDDDELDKFDLILEVLEEYAYENSTNEELTRIKNLAKVAASISKNSAAWWVAIYSAAADSRTAAICSANKLAEWIPIQEDEDNGIQYDFDCDYVPNYYEIINRLIDFL